MELFGEERHRGMPWAVEDGGGATRGGRGEEFHGPSGNVTLANGVLIAALNIGVNPPDLVRPQRPPVLEAWVDVTRDRPRNTTEQIAQSLKSQFRLFQSKKPVEFQVCSTPTREALSSELPKARRSAGRNRVLMYYNGHGVLKPSADGEIWVFNPEYSHYIPVATKDLVRWLGTPSLLIFDCSAAAIPAAKFVSVLEKSAQMAVQSAAMGSRTQAEQEAMKQAQMDVIIFAACGAKELLPQHPDYPIDIFTACLTTPIKMAVWWFARRSPHPYPGDIYDKLKGNLSDKSTPLGELNWIFTSVTDTIAWSTFSPQNFKKFMRTDSYTSTFFRNYLLAERIMRTFDCTPYTYPELPPTYNHKMWGAWDFALTQCLEQVQPVSNGEPYKSSSFFEDQLSAFERWLESALPDEPQSPPQQLPIMVHVLLGKPYRVRVLSLFCRFVDLGEWAVKQLFHVDAIVYFYQLLMKNDVEYIDRLVVLFAKIMSFNSDCNAPLVRSKNHKFFFDAFASDRHGEPLVRPLAAYCLSLFVREFAEAHKFCCHNDIFSVCKNGMRSEDPILREWSLLCLSQVWRKYDGSRPWEYNESDLKDVEACLDDKFPEVRAAAVFALGSLISEPVSTACSPHPSKTQRNRISRGTQGEFIAGRKFKLEYEIMSWISELAKDPSPLVRAEIAHAFSRFFAAHWNYVSSDILVDAVSMTPEEQGEATHSSSNSMRGFSPAGMSPQLMRQRPARRVFMPDQDTSENVSVYRTFWITLCHMVNDPQYEVAKLADEIAKRIEERIRAEEDDERFVPGNTHLSAMHPGIHSTVPICGEDHIEAFLHPVYIPSKLFKWACQRWKKPLFTPDNKKEILEKFVEKAELSKAYIRSRVEEANEILANMRTKPKEPTETRYIRDELPIVAKTIAFHPYEKILVGADDKNAITVVDWKNRSVVNVFSNENIYPEQITTLTFTNDTYSSHLLVGTSDGVVRVYNDYDSTQKMVSSFQALTVRGFDTKLSTGFLGTSTLLAAGDSNNIEVFDLAHECPITKLVADETAAVTSMSIGRGEANTFVCGFYNGELRLYDVRAQEPATKYPAVKGRVKDIEIISDHEIVVNYDGGVKTVDSRTGATLRGIETNEVAVFGCHRNAPFMAFSTLKQQIKSYTHAYQPLASIRYHNASGGTRITNATCLTYHPYKFVLGASFVDGVISLFRFDV